VPNPTVAAAATGLPVSNVIPFPHPVGEDFKPISVDESSLQLTSMEVALMRLAARVLAKGPAEMRRLSNPSEEAESYFRRTVEEWNFLGERLAVLIDLLAEADRRVSMLLPEAAHG
jgi:hypothetical protein